MELNYSCEKAQYDEFVRLFECFPRKGAHSELFGFSHLLTVNDSTTASLQHLEGSVSLLVTYINESVSHLWPVRDENKRVVQALTLRSHLDRCQLFLTESTSQLSNILISCSQRSISLRQQKNSRYLETKLTFCQQQTIPLLINRLNHIIIETITSSYQLAFNRFFTSNPDVFLDSWTLLHASWSCNSSKNGNSSRSAENVLFETVIGKSAVYSLSVSSVVSVCSSLSPDRPTIFRDLIADILSTQILTLLNAIINSNVSIDEAGLYKLYRLILKLQEATTTTRQQLGLPPSEQLVHPSIWLLTQFIIDYLNESIFDANNQNVPLIRTPFPPIPTTLEKYQKLRKSWKNIADGNVWRNLTKKFSKNRSMFDWKKMVSWKKRHSGTVFVVLTVPPNPM